MASEHATWIHSDSIVVDATCPVGHWKAHRDAWVAGGATACVLSVNGMSVRETVHNIADIYRLSRKSSSVRVATSVADIRAAKVDGDLAVVLHFQGVEPIEYEPLLLDAYWQMGVRIIQLSYNRRNPLCDGCEEPSDAGLSMLGRRMIASMNRLGVLVDVSHTGTRSSLEAIEASSAPCIASHSNAAAVHANRRNIPDALIRAIAESGGVIGVNGFPSFVAETRRPTLDEFIDHMVHIDTLVGSGHVGLGVDFWQGSVADYESQLASGLWSSITYPPPPYHYPVGLDDPSRLPRVAARLVERGYSEHAVRGILGENWLRVFGEVWK